MFDDLLNRVFKGRLADCIPEWVLPVSTRPPKDLKVLIDSALSQVDQLLQSGSRKGIQAAARQYLNMSRYVLVTLSPEKK